jgi:hypothetical protein
VNLKEKILIFRTCLAVLVLLRAILMEMAEEKFKQKVENSVDPLRKLLSDHLNFLYAQESKSKIQR